MDSALSKRADLVLPDDTTTYESSAAFLGMEASRLGNVTIAIGRMFVYNPMFKSNMFKQCTWASKHVSIDDMCDF